MDNGQCWCWVRMDLYFVQHDARPGGLFASAAFCSSLLRPEVRVVAAPEWVVKGTQTYRTGTGTYRTGMDTVGTVGVFYDV
jgi:hypothetical protein